jgi:hypothetical protein
MSWIKQKTPTGIMYSKKGASYDNNDVRLIRIDAIPRISLETMKVIGHTYSMITNTSYGRFRRFTNKAHAISYANRLMGK